MTEDELGDIIAHNLDTLAKEKDIAPTVWAKAVGMGHTGVLDIIKRKAQSPRYLTLVKLAEHVGVDVRRITVGPDYLDRDKEEADILDLLSQLEPSERKFLLNAAKAQLAERNRESE